MTKEYYLAHRKEIAEKKRIYQQTDGYKQSHALVEKKYSQTDKAVAKRDRYFKSEKGIATQKRHDLKRNITEARIKQVRAHKAVAQSVKMGRMVRCSCEICGDVKSFAHHHKGYELENIFNVKWLCRKHHIDAHRTCP